MTCSHCGTAAPLLVGGKCAGCWTDEQDQRAPLVRRVLEVLRPAPSDLRAVA